MYCSPHPAVLHIAPAARLREFCLYDSAPGELLYEDGGQFTDSRVEVVRGSFFLLRVTTVAVRITPARVVAEEAAWYLGFSPHDIPVLVSAGLLKPLGHPPSSGTKFFAAATLQKLRDDLNWLARASDAIVRHWQVKNARKGQNGRAFGPHLQPVQIEQR